MCKRQKSKEFKLTSTLTLKLNVNVNVKVKRKGLSHLMGEASCPSFIGRVWSGAQQMRQKIWTPTFVIAQLSMGLDDSF